LLTSRRRLRNRAACYACDIFSRAPRSGIVEIAGPERAPFNEIIARYLKAVGDLRKVVSDPEAGSRSARSCRRAKRASAASVSTNGCAAHGQQPDPQQPTEG